MANTLGFYNPAFYANEALLILKKSLGLAARVHRGYEAERNAFARGETINIRRPSSFSTQNAPAASSSNVTTDSVTITLNQWKEVRFELTDKELAFTGEKIIDEHISPAVYAIADTVDQYLAGFYKKIPWYVDEQSSASVLDLTNVREILRENKVPLDDQSRLHLMVGPNMENRFLQLSQFHDSSVAGAAAQASLMRGSLGVRFGFEVFANQNAPTYTKADLADKAGTITGTPVLGATSITIGSLGGDGETIQEGDIITIAGHTQQYVVTTGADVATTSATVSISPGLEAACSGGEVVGIVQDTCVNNIAFHRNFMALAMAPLPMTSGQGAEQFVATDPMSGLSIRATMWYDANNKKRLVSLDVLYGATVLDQNMAVRLRGEIS